MNLSETVLQICLRFTREGKHDKKTDCKSASKRFIMIKVSMLPDIYNIAVFGNEPFGVLGIGVHS